MQDLQPAGGCHNDCSGIYNPVSFRIYSEQHMYLCVTVHWDPNVEGSPESTAFIGNGASNLSAPLPSPRFRVPWNNVPNVRCGVVEHMAA